MRPCFDVLSAALFLLLCTLASAEDLGDPHEQGQPIQVVTSFSILQNLTEELGGSLVSVTNLVGVDSDGHAYQPKPSDAVAVVNADLVIFNGLGFEGWIPRLLTSVGYRGRVVVASENVNVRTLGPVVIDPHAWQSISNIYVYADNITRSLKGLRPDSSEELEGLNQSFKRKIADLEKQIETQFRSIPVQNRVVVTSHDSFGYLGRELGVQFLAPVGVTTNDEPSARDLAKLINQIRAQNVRAIFMENISNPKSLEQLVDETQVAVGATLYSDALSTSDEPANTYVAMMYHNAQAIYEALKH